MLPNLTYLFAIWLATFVVGLVSWPLAAKLFGKLSDHGYSLAKAIGFLAVAYLSFLAVSLRLLALSEVTIFGVLGFWIAANIAIQIIWKPLRINEINFKQLAGIEAAFLLLSGLWIWVRAHNPAILDIERFMDYGFLRTLYNSSTLPLPDMWLAGEQINYYYFGHFLSYIILTLSRLAPVQGFLTLVAWLFGIVGIISYRLGRDLFALRLPQARIWPACAGAVSVFFVLFAGTWHTTAWVFGYLRHLISGVPIPNFWYPDPTRFIPGTITEMPFYSFLEADIHPHVWGLLLGLLVLHALFVLWHSSDTAISRRLSILGLLAMLLAAAFMTNSWDGPSLGLLTGLIILVSFRTMTAGRRLLVIGLTAAVSLMLAAPWKLTVDFPITGLGVVTSHSPFWAWLSFFGPFAALALVWLWLLNRARQHKHADAPHSFYATVIAAASLLIIFIEFFYVRDILDGGEFFRVNTFFKVSSQVWLWLSVIAGPVIILAVRQPVKRTVRIPLIIILLLAFFAGQAVYPIKTIKQARLNGLPASDLAAGDKWWEKYPDDYEALKYLQDEQNSLPRGDRMRIILEAPGSSYTDDSRFSVFLGWPTVVGWDVHEWTWRGNYDIVGSRTEEVREIYTGTNVSVTQNLLAKYKIDYIIIGQAERLKYGENLNTEKLSIVGELVFVSGETSILRVY